MKKVSVIGVGRLGLSFSLLLNSKGYEVCGCDVNEKYVQSLKYKTFESKEPYINEMLQKSDMIFTTDEKEAFYFSDILFVFVATPSKQSGEYDHKYIEQVVSKIEKYWIKNKTLVIGCTVMPGYCKKLQEKLSPFNIYVVYNPEFIAQGNIVNDLRGADIVLIGVDIFTSLARDTLFGIYGDIIKTKPLFKVLSLTSAEIAKISINCFLTLKVSFANLIGDILINSGEEKNILNVLEAIGSDSRIGNKYLSYGFSAGGPCLPRDQNALNKHAYFVHVFTKLMQEIDTENNRHADYLKSYYVASNEDINVPFLFSSLSYKEGVYILTDSYQLRLCLELLRSGYKVDVPPSTKDMDMPEEFKDYVYNDMVTFGTVKKGYKVN